MRLGAKWTMWFAAIGLYVAFMGGIFYYRFLQGVFDEKLKQEAVDLVQVYAPTLITGLLKNPSSVTMAEFDIITKGIANDERVAALVYFNRFGEVRWFKDPAWTGKAFDEFTKQFPPPTDALEQAYASKAPKVRAVADKSLYEIAIPLAVRGDVVGIMDMQVSRAGVGVLMHGAMVKYAAGASVVLLILGFALYFFLHLYVINPLLHVHDAIEAISFKNLALKYSLGKDEIGDVANALQVFLQKVKAEMANATAREKQRNVAEQRWWRSILDAVVAKQHYALVVDEDNSVLYANFPITVQTADPAAKLHLLDVLDSQQQDVLRLVGSALDRPNEVVEAETVFRQQACRVRAVHLQEEGELRRTLVLFEPKKESSYAPDPHAGSGPIKPTFSG